MISLGALNDRARIERPVGSTDASYGTQVTTWELVEERWCSIQDILPSRSEGIARGMNISSSAARVRMRWTNRIDSTMRIVMRRPDEVVYRIIGGPAELGVREGIELLVERVSTDG